MCYAASCLCYRRVPDTFLSTSHEYNRISDYGDDRTVAAWAEVFKMLSPSPIIRVGGASQDKMTQVKPMPHLLTCNTCCPQLVHSPALLGC
jgi:hypothetical protein